MADDIETRLTRARTRLIIDKPFLGALVLRLPLVAADPKWCQTTATDARKLYYNPEYIDALSNEQVQFVISHEALHCALSHFARRGHRNRMRWDVACDYAINPLLMADGLKPPPGALYEDSFEGMTAEEIYPFIDENTADEPMDRHVYDDDEDSGEQPPPPGPQDRDEPPPKGDSPGEGDDGEAGGQGQADPDSGGAPQPPPLSGGEQETLQIQWQQRMAGAAQQAMQAGKLGGLLARMIDHLLQPRLPWRMLLARYMTAVARDDYSYMRPSRREGNAILPSLRSSQLDVVVAVDTSGSVQDRELREFAAEVNAIKGQMRARVTLVVCDSAVSEDSPWCFEPWEELELPADLKGGGGTDFRPVFDWIERQDRQPDLLVYFTDANGEFPTLEPAYGTVWLVKGKRSVPWGQRVQLN